MKKLLFLCCLFFSTHTFAQSKDTSLKNLEKSMKELDSQIAINNKRRDSINMARDMEQNNRNLDWFMASQRERERKQKQQMWLRLGFGVILLGVGIYGVMRRRKKPADNTGAVK